MNAKQHLLSVALLATFAPVGAQTLGGANTQASNTALAEKCDAPKGTMAVVEPQSEVIAALMRYSLQSPTPLIRMIIQQSNCFQVVERGAGMRNLMQERALAESGQMQADQNIGKGQMVAADFVLTPSVVISNPNAGGAGGGLGALGGRLGILGAIAGGLKFKEASTSMIMSDARSSLQIASAEGSAQKTDFNIGGVLFGGGAGAALGGYTNTAEGKLIAASFLDNWNNIVKTIRGNASLIQAKAGVAAQANAAGSVRAGAGNAGDVYVAKIAGVKALRAPAEGSGEIATLSKTDEVIFEGEERDGFIKVATSNGTGWVKAIMMKKQ
jgi:Curli production assembly/transport component CsgG